jgi:hypothetical protein
VGSDKILTPSLSSTQIISTATLTMPHFPKRPVCRSLSPLSPRKAKTTANKKIRKTRKQYHGQIPATPEGEDVEYDPEVSTSDEDGLETEATSEADDKQASSEEEEDDYKVRRFHPFVPQPP